MPTLALPPAGYPPGAVASGSAALDATRLLEYASVRLFCERARLQSPDFTLSAANAADVVQICRKLDGIPLALELAAARVRSLPPAQILARLDDRFRILKGGSRTAMPRQQTLEALIDWSYDLLSPPEKRLLQHLTIFSGGWTLESAEEICDVPPPVAGYPLGAGDGQDDYGADADVLDLLTSLVDKSLVVFSGDEGLGRYRLLETIKHYAAMKSRRSATFSDVEARHTDFFPDACAGGGAEPSRPGPGQVARTAGTGARQPPSCARAVPAGRHGAHRHSRRNGPGTLWGPLVVLVCTGLSERGPRVAQTRHRAQSQTRRAARGGADWPGHALSSRQRPADGGGRAWGGARDWRDAGNARGVAVSLTNLGIVAVDNGHLDRARSLYQECIALWEDLGDNERLAAAWNNLGAVVRLQGDAAEARRLFQRGLEYLRAHGDMGNVALMLYNLAELALDEKDFEASEAHLTECLAILVVNEDRYVHAHAVHMLGALAYQTERDRAALCLWGASQAAFAQMGAALQPADAEALDAAKRTLRERLGEALYTEFWQSGNGLSLTEAAATLNQISRS